MASRSTALLNQEFAGFAQFDIVMVSQPVGPAGIDDLLPCERQAVARARPQRLREFVAGRKAARGAMAHLGVEDAELPRSREGYPVWPLGIMGSISHTRDLAVAAVSRDKRLAGVGIDIEEPSLASGCSIAERLLTEHELAALETMPAAHRQRHIALVSSCKEAAYKAVFPLAHEDIDFLDIEVMQLDGAGAFQVTGASSRKSAGLFGMGRGNSGSVRGKHVSLFVVEAEIQPV